MSKNKNYGNYFKKPKVEEPVKDDREEIPAVEEPTKAPVEEEKVEEAPTEEVIERDLEQEVGKTYAIVTGAKKVNMRENASTEAKVLIVLSMGTKVEFLDYVYGPGKAWAKIRYNGREGYMMEQYLKHVAN